MSFATNGTHFVAYDGNGNVSALVNAADGTVSANYEYDPFGQTIRDTGTVGKLNPIRFSTQFVDDVKGDAKYLYRPYGPSTGTWPNRDPKEERRGAKNLYGFLGNHPVGAYDVLGLYSVESCQNNVDDIMANPGKHSKELRKVLEAIKSIKGCKPLKPKCKCCTGEDKNWVGYVQGESLNICANNISDTRLLLETLVHENIHVLQRCRKKDLDSCDGAVCTEIQAALNDGTCQRTSPGDVRGCVINEAATSSQERCGGSKEKALERAEALYESCNTPIP